MIKIIQSNQFKKKYKKYNKKIQDIIIEKVKIIKDDRYIGEKKKGDLQDYLVLKFRVGVDQYLLAYRNLSDDLISLEAIGSHENFYRDLKRNQ